MRWPGNMGAKLLVGWMAVLFLGGIAIQLAAVLVVGVDGLAKVSPWLLVGVLAVVGLGVPLSQIKAKAELKRTLWFTLIMAVLMVLMVWGLFMLDRR